MGAIKNLAAGAASFIPGAGPIISGMIGAIPTGGSKVKQNQQTKQTDTIDMTNNVDMFDEAIEDGAFSQGRQALGQMLQQQMRKANQPVYGDAQKASFLSNLNDLGETAMQSLKSQMASMGRSNSGSFDAAMGDIGRERIGQATQFFGNLPFMEQQAQAERMNPLMNMATNWYGRAPISQRRTGTTTEKGTRVSEGNMTGQSQQQGPGFWGNFANNMAGSMAQTGQGNIPSMFGSPKMPTEFNPSAWNTSGGFLNNVGRKQWS